MPEPHDLSFGSLARDAVAVVRAHPLTLALPFVLFSLVTGSGGDPNEPWDADQGLEPEQVLQYLPFFALLGLIAIAVFVVVFVVAVVFGVTMAHAELQSQRDGRPPDLRAAFQAARATWAADSLTALLAVGAVILGFLLLVVPGFIVIAALVPLIVVMAAERLRNTAAIRRSFDLARGYKGRLLGLVLCAGVASVLATLLLAWIPVLGGALADAANGLVNAALLAASVLFYHRRTSAPAAGQPTSPVVDEPGAPMV